MISLPGGHGRIERVEYFLNRLTRRSVESAAKFSVKVYYLSGGRLHLCRITTRIDPEPLPFAYRQSQIEFGVAATEWLCFRDTLFRLLY